MEETLKEQDEILRVLKDHLRESQVRMKKFADLKQMERSFEVGEWVYLWLKPSNNSQSVLDGTKNLLLDFTGLSKFLRS